MNICVIGGAGYVGIVTSVCLSEVGHRVIAVDVDRGRIRSLQSGESPIYEEGVAELLTRNLRSEHLSFTTGISEAVKASEVIFIAVGTPAKADGQVDISQVVRVSEEIAGCLNSYKVVAIRSTVPLEAIDLIRKKLSQRNEEGKDFDIVANPEFLREGKGVRDFLFPDRIVIGTDSERARQIVKAVYEPIVQGKVSVEYGSPNSHRPDTIPVVETTVQAAQIIKYASNAFLASRISFINEVASLCEQVGADITDVVQGMGYDPRIGHAYLAPGPGFGGPCLEKDLRALISISANNGHQAHLLKAVLERNEAQVERVADKLKLLVGEPLRGKTVAVLGLAFKAETNDTRDSPALKLIDLLKKEGVRIRVHDPVALPECQSEDEMVTYWEEPYLVAQGADALIIMTEWSEFRELDYGRIKSVMASPCILDARNLLDPWSVTALGFKYSGIGR